MTYSPTRLISLGLMLIGSFVPWYCIGDLVSSCVPGVVIEWYAGSLQFAEYGGGLIFWLSLVLWVIVLTNIGQLRTALFVYWGLVALSIVILIRTLMVILGTISQTSVVGGTTPHVGLLVLWFGVVVFVVGERQAGRGAG